MENLVMIRPAASLAEVSTRIAQLYGFNVEKIEQLDGYDDLNFYVKCTSADDIETTRYVCKVLNANDSRRTDFIESQHRLMTHLGDSGIRVPRPITNKNHKLFSLETFGECLEIVVEVQTTPNLGQYEHVFRLLKFVPGKRLNDVLPSADLYRNVGTFIGQLSLKLKNYEDEQLKTRKVLWNLDSVPKLHQYVHAVPDKQRQDLVTSVVRQFENLVIPAIPQMENGVIHGDLNEHNILVDGTEVAGLIDFGDVNYAPALFEVAISLTYMMIHARDLSIGKPFLEGYQKHRKLNDVERDLLKICVSARAAQSLTLGCYSALEAPNNEYILSSQKNGWFILNQLVETPDSELRTLWGLI